MYRTRRDGRYTPLSVAGREQQWRGAHPGKERRREREDEQRRQPERGTAGRFAVPVRPAGPDRLPPADRGIGGRHLTGLAAEEIEVIERIAVRRRLERHRHRPCLPAGGRRRGGSREHRFAPGRRANGRHGAHGKTAFRCVAARRWWRSKVGYGELRLLDEVTVRDDRRGHRECEVLARRLVAVDCVDGDRLDLSRFVGIGGRSDGNDLVCGDRRGGCVDGEGLVVGFTWGFSSGRLLDSGRFVGASLRGERHGGGLADGSDVGGLSGVNACRSGIADRFADRSRGRVSRRRIDGIDRLTPRAGWAFLRAIGRARTAAAGHPYGPGFGRVVVRHCLAHGRVDGRRRHIGCRLGHGRRVGRLRRRGGRRDVRRGRLQRCCCRRVRCGVRTPVLGPPGRVGARRRPGGASSARRRSLLRRALAIDLGHGGLRRRRFRTAHAFIGHRVSGFGPHRQSVSGEKSGRFGRRAARSDSGVSSRHAATAGRPRG